MKDESMQTQSKMPSSTLQGLRSQRSKDKLNAKLAPNAEFKLQKISSQSKLDKRRSANEYHQEEVETEKMFRLHARTHINEEQALLSLKLLGYLCNTTEDYAKFQKTWAKYGPIVDETGFKALASEVEGRGQLKDHSTCFNILTQGKMMLDQKRLKSIGEELGYNFQSVMRDCGKEGVIDFSQFDGILKFMNALN